MTATPPRPEFRGLLATLAAGLLGLGHAAGFSPTFSSGWLQLATLAGFLLVVRAARTRGALVARCLAFGIAWFGAGVGWLYTSMHVYGGMPSALAALAVLLFATYLALFPLAAVMIAGRLAGVMTGCAGAFAGAFTLAALWGASELLRGWLFTGFPWLSIGYAHIDGPLAGYAPWVGVYGIGALAALVAALVAASMALFSEPGARARAVAPAFAALVVLALGAALSTLEPTRPDGPPVSVRLAQGNVPQQMKFDPRSALAAMLDYTAMVESSDAQLVVLPETAWTVPWPRTPAAIGQRLLEHTQRTGAAVAIGMPLAAAAADAQEPARYTNSVVLLSAGAASDRYDKRHLVPFGEFIPTGFAWFVNLMNIPLGEFGRGSPGQPPFPIAGQRFAFNICYEDLFGQELIGAIRDHGASVLVNVSNIAWFGDSHALPQHLAIARMRTLETGRPMLRATNTGATASIDHRGQVLALLPFHRRDVLDVSVQGTSGLTAYVRAGNWLPAGLIAVLLVAGQLARWWRGRRR